MTNLFFVDFANNAIVASKTTLKKARIPNSPEYKELVKLMKKHPTFAVVEKDIKKPTNKKTYHGLTNDFIKRYISLQDNADELEKQYNKATEMGKFPLVRKWFLNTFKNFDMTAAQEMVDMAILAEIAA